MWPPHNSEHLQKAKKNPLPVFGQKLEVTVFSLLEVLMPSEPPLDTTGAQLCLLSEGGMAKGRGQELGSHGSNTPQLHNCANAKIKSKEVVLNSSATHLKWARDPLVHPDAQFGNHFSKAFREALPVLAKTGSGFRRTSKALGGCTWLHLGIFHQGGQLAPKAWDPVQLLPCLSYIAVLLSS